MDFKTTSLALLLFFLIGNFPISAQKYVLKNEQKHQPNTLIVKVKNNSTHAFQADGKMNQNQKVNTLLSRLGVKKARRLFKEKTLDKIGVRKKLVNISKYNIENIYKLEIAETQNLEQVIAELKKESWILYAEPAYAHKTLFEVDDTFASFQYGHINSQVYDAWDIEKGDTSVIVGVIDTGCRTSHPEFEGQLQYNWAEKNGTIGIDDDLNGFVDDTLGYDFGDWDNDITDPGVHGTEVTSIIASKVNNGFGTVGVGFNTRVLPVRIATYNNGEYLRNEYEGVMYAVENGARIINLSWGRKGFPSQYEQDIINYITDIYDVMVVAAAGNTNAYIDFYPASYHNVLSVSHSDLNDARDVNATYSYFIDLQAFGVRPVASTWYVNQFDEGHQNVTGSSYASPFVAGIGALVAAHYPDLSALQIAELLRISSDNVYDTLGNAPYPEQLGKGRVNALRALLERGDSPALRMKNFAYSGDFGNYLVADDTLEITADFINYLRPSTSNLTVSLSTVSSFATVLTENQTFNLGVMNTFGEKNNTAAPFKLHLHSDIPDNHTIYLRLGFTDDNYTDFQYFAITFQQKTLDIGFARIGLGIGTNGRLGALGTPQNPVGMGFTFDGIQIMGELGLMISQNSNTVSDAVLSTPNNKNNDFKATSPVLVHEVLDTLLSVVSSFNDLAENLNPIGLEIDQKVSGSYIAPHQNYISLEYNIKNVSGNIIDSLNIALFADWDLAGSQNFADWDTLNGFGYIYDEQNNYMGIKISNPNNSYFAFDMTDVGGNNINLTDEFSSLEKHQAMSNRISRTKAGYGIGGGNVAHSVGTTVFNLQTDSTYKVHFTIMGGTSLAELQNTLPNTTIFTSQLEQGETPEFADSVFCKNVSFPISPLGGFAFNFYKDASLDTLLHSGASLLIENPDTITTYYVTNIDKTLESDVATIRLHASQIEADFSFPTTLKLGLK